MGKHLEGGDESNALREPNVRGSTHDIANDPPDYTGRNRARVISCLQRVHVLRTEANRWRGDAGISPNRRREEERIEKRPIGNPDELPAGRF